VIATAQRRGFDCGVACVAMFCHVDYADAFYVAVGVAGTKIRQGLNVGQVQRIAERLQRPLVRVSWQKVDLEEDSGILGVRWTDKPAWADGHWVVLRCGTIIDPDPAAPRVWDADIYMKHHKARPATLLTERTEGRK
jgi:hypothetical protein